MEDDSTTAPKEDNSADSQVDNQPNPGATDNGTEKNDNPDTSKSTDDTSVDDDKKSKTDNDAGGDSTPTFDADLDEWAEKTNRPKPTTDRERELYQEIRNGQREYSRKQQAKDAETSVNKAIQDAAPDDNKQEEDDDDPVAADVAELKRQNREERNMRLRGEYFSDKSVTSEESKMMGEILKEKVDKAKSPAAKKAAYEFWTDPENLEDWHTLAKARLADAGMGDKTVIEEEAARKERERIAKEHQAAGPSRNASQTQPQKPRGYNRTEYLKSDD